MALAASSPTDRVEQLIILTERLTDIIMNEIAALKDRRPSDIKEYETEKTKLARAYSHEMQLIHRQRNLIEGVARDLMQSLKAATAAFREALAQQQALLSSARTVTEGMIKSIAEEVAAKKKPVVGYGKHADLRKGGANRPTPITYNKVI